jgi:hypothetical protein
MTIRSTITHARARARDVGLLALGIALLASGAAAQTVDVFDVDHVTLAWDPASGPVAGYYVEVSRNAGPAELSTITAGLQASVSGSVGDEIQVTVTAYDTAGDPGPASAPSPLIRFNATPPPDEPTTSDPTPPPDEPTTSDPTPLPDEPTTSVRHTAHDFNGDGSSDLLLRDPAGKLSIWTMDGSVKLGTTPVNSLATNWKVVDDGDYDGNGMSDLVWQDSESNAISVWLLDGGSVIGVHTPDVSGSQGTEGWKVGGSGDFDGDGADDLFLFNTITGESVVYRIDASGVASTSPLPGYLGDWKVDDIGDYDHDGLDEVIWRDQRRHDLVVWDLDGAGPDAPSFVSNTIKGWRLVGSGDFDGDGAEDLFVVRSEPDKVEVWLLKNAVISGIVSLPLATSADWTAMAVGDYDADGLSDLAWSDAISGEMEIWFSDGDAVTQVPVSSADGTISTSRSATLVTGTEGSDDLVYRQRLCDGDFNGDGVVNFVDSTTLSGCIDQPATGVCEPADMDSDGVVSEQDVKRFQKSMERGVACAQ